MAQECGTGGWTGPKPGDPNTSDVLLTATPAFGGIDLNWTYPNINPNAVAYTVIYRSLLPDPESAAVLVHAQGSFYYDRMNISTSVVYYYWIRIYSIYGTPSDLIGPAWSNAKPLIEDLMQELTGRIDAGALAEGIKQEIDQITLNKLAITQEMLDRDANDEALGIRITEVSAITGETRALLQEEVLARTSANEAFVGTVDTMYTELNGNVTAVQSSVTVLQNDLQTLAEKTDTLETSFGDSMAQLEQRMTVEIKTVNDKVVEIGARWDVRMTVNGLAGGFGVYNDGRTVEAGFDVDRFWVGRTNANKIKPFIIENDVVYIDEAAINKLTFSKLRDESGAFVVENGRLKADYIDAALLVVNQAQSKNFVHNQTGWALKEDGTFELNGNIPNGARMSLTNEGLRIYHPNGVRAIDLSVNVL